MASNPDGRSAIWTHNGLILMRGEEIIDTVYFNKVGWDKEKKPFEAAGKTCYDWVEHGKLPDLYEELENLSKSKQPTEDLSLDPAYYTGRTIVMFGPSTAQRPSPKTPR